MITIVVSSYGLIEQLYDERGEFNDYEIIDLTSWEYGSCPFCGAGDDDVVVVGGRKAIDEDGKDLGYILGGILTCKICGCNEQTDIERWVQEHANGNNSN